MHDEEKEILARKHLPFVTSIVKKYNIDRDDYDEMFAEGCIGLAQALNSWSESRDVKFITYAYYCVRSSIVDYLRKQVRYENREKTGFFTDYFLDGQQKDPEIMLIEKEQLDRAHQELELIEDGMTEREKYVLYNHVLGDKPESLRSIAEKFDTSYESIRRDKNRVTSRLEGGVSDDLWADSEVQ
jgi:RNA polymerase sigma factor (sigma-70 family)